MTVDPDNTLAREVLLNAIAKRKSGKLDLPDDTNVEKLMLETGAYKLGTGPHHVTQINRQFPVSDAVLVKIQNVRDYYMAHWKEHKWDEIRSFTCVKLPFPKILFSYDHSFKNMDTGAVTSRHLNVGLALCSRQNFLDRAIQSKVDLGETIHELHALDPDRMIEARIAIDGMSMPGQWYVGIDKLGQVLTDEEHHLGWIWIRNPVETEVLYERHEWAEEFEAQVCRHACIALAAVQFMNCKNVEILDNPPTRQQRRQAEREGKKPETTYKTLLIHPFGRKRQIVKHEDGSTVHGVALHIVRGHFKDYRSGQGLGRTHIKGIWWWSPQVRGREDVGKVVKDYAVAAE
jgi:hypothetical protein